MELSIASPRLLKEKSEIKREKVDHDDDDGEDDDQPCLQLFGEKVVAGKGDYGTRNYSNLMKVGKPANLRMTDSSVPSPAADNDDDDDDDDADRDCGGEVQMMSSYRKGVTHFRLGGAGGGGGHQQRHSSILERQILPGMSSTGQAGGERQSSAAPKQLTMFYAGRVNVFDNIPADKVEAIILLARESCSSKQAGGVLPKFDMKMQPHTHNNSCTTPLSRPRFAGGCKLQADQQLPVARKISLQHFMEKRRLRITSKSPYFSSYTEQHQDHDDEEEGRSGDNIRSDEDRHKISLSPFPSRSGYLL